MFDSGCLRKAMRYGIQVNVFDADNRWKERSWGKQDMVRQIFYRC